MITVAEIKQAIEWLSPQARCKLEAFLHPWPDDDGDRQMQADAESGSKLHDMMSALGYSLGGTENARGMPVSVFRERVSIR